MQGTWKRTLFVLVLLLIWLPSMAVGVAAQDSGRERRSDDVSEPQQPPDPVDPDSLLPALLQIIETPTPDWVTLPTVPTRTLRFSEPIATDVAQLDQSETEGETAFVFASLFNPVGVTTYANGNVLAQHDNVNSLLFTLFAPNGTPLTQQSFGGFTSTDTFKLATFQPTGDIFGLSSNGEVYVINPTTLQTAFWFNIRALNITIDQIYNVTTGMFGTAAGIILPQFANYGDIAILARSVDNFDLFISGDSQGAPFILRIQIRSSQSTAEVVIASIFILPNNTLPRGVAVNADGVVLTSLLGILGYPPASERLIAFNAGFPQDPTLPVYSSYSVISRGMATDQTGNFYIAMLGASPCPANGGILILNADLFFFDCFLAPSFITDPRDVAAASSGGVAYLSTNQNQILGFSIPEIPQIQFAFLPLLRR